MNAINLTVAFLLELAALAALAVWGAHTGGIVLAVAAPVLLAVLWGALLAPKASVQLPPAAHLALTCLVFATAAAALASTGQVTLAVLLAGTFVFNQAAIAALA
jgi:hypothetical protein